MDSQQKIEPILDPDSKKKLMSDQKKQESLDLKHQVIQGHQDLNEHDQEEGSEKNQNNANDSDIIKKADIDDSDIKKSNNLIEDERLQKNQFDDESIIHECQNIILDQHSDRKISSILQLRIGNTNFKSQRKLFRADQRDQIDQDVEQGKYYILQKLKFQDYKKEKIKSDGKCKSLQDLKHKLKHDLEFNFLLLLIGGFISLLFILSFTNQIFFFFPYKTHCTLTLLKSRALQIYSYIVLTKIFLSLCLKKLFDKLIMIFNNFLKLLPRVSGPKFLTFLTILLAINLVTSYFPLLNPLKIRGSLNSIEDIDKTESHFLQIQQLVDNKRFLLIHDQKFTRPYILRYLSAHNQCYYIVEIYNQQLESIPQTLSSQPNISFQNWEYQVLRLFSQNTLQFKTNGCQGITFIFDNIQNLNQYSIRKLLSFGLNIHDNYSSSKVVLVQSSSSNKHFMEKYYQINSNAMSRISIHKIRSLNGEKDLNFDSTITKGQYQKAQYTQNTQNTQKIIEPQESHYSNPLFRRGKFAPVKNFIENYKIVKDIKEQINKERFLLIYGPKLIGKSQALKFFARKSECNYYVSLRKSLNQIPQQFSATKGQSFQEWSKQLTQIYQNKELRMFTEGCHSVKIIIENLQNLQPYSEVKYLMLFGKQMYQNFQNFKLILSETQRSGQMRQHLQLLNRYSSQQIQTFRVYESFSNQEFLQFYLQGERSGISIKQNYSTTRSLLDSRDIIWLLNLTGRNFQTINCLQSQNNETKVWKNCAFKKTKKLIEGIQKYIFYKTDEKENEHDRKCFKEEILKIIQQTWKQQEQRFMIKNEETAKYYWNEEQFYPVSPSCYFSNSLSNDFFIKREKPEVEQNPRSRKYEIKIRYPYLRAYFLSLVYEYSNCSQQYQLTSYFKESVKQGNSKENPWKKYHPLTLNESSYSDSVYQTCIKEFLKSA